VNMLLSSNRPSVADSPRKPISAQTVFDKGRYVNLRGGFQTDLSAGRGRDGHFLDIREGFYINWLSLDLPPSRASGSNDRDGEFIEP